jgi:hypothetical protein
MVSATALGLRGEDEPVSGTLIPLVKDEYGFVELYAPYLLRLVVADRRGPSGDGAVTFYDDLGGGSGGGCGCGVVCRAPWHAAWLPGILALLVLLRLRRDRR